MAPNELTKSQLKTWDFGAFSLGNHSLGVETCGGWPTCIQPFVRRMDHHILSAFSLTRDRPRAYPGHNLLSATIASYWINVKVMWLTSHKSFYNEQVILWPKSPFLYDLLIWSWKIKSAWISDLTSGFRSYEGLWSARRSLFEWLCSLDLGVDQS